MGNGLLECYKRERTGKPLDSVLKHDAEYQKKKKRYHEISEKMKNKLFHEDTSRDDNIILELDEAFGDYSASYGDAAYSLGFRDGMEIGLEYKITGEEQKIMEMTVQDMADLIQVHDAYKSLNTSLHGNFTAYAFDEGILGKMSRIYPVIARHFLSKYQENDTHDGEKILADTSMEPEERAKILMMGN